jgi:hypothetical protein
LLDGREAVTFLGKLSFHHCCSHSRPLHNERFGNLRL